MSKNIKNLACMSIHLKNQVILLFYFLGTSMHIYPKLEKKTIFIIVYNETRWLNQNILTKSINWKKVTLPPSFRGIKMRKSSQSGAWNFQQSLFVPQQNNTTENLIYKSRKVILCILVSTRHTQNLPGRQSHHMMVWLALNRDLVSLVTKPQFKIRKNVVFPRAKKFWWRTNWVEGPTFPGGSLGTGSGSWLSSWGTPHHLCRVDPGQSRLAGAPSTPAVSGASSPYSECHASY